MITWDRVYLFDSAKTSVNCQADSVFETLEGGFLASGISNSRLSILKVDYYGNKEWARQYNCFSPMLAGKWAYHVQETQEGFSLAMIKPDGYRAGVVLLDPYGNEIGSSIIGNTSIKSIEALTLTPENTLTIAGKTDRDILVMGFDENGNAVWDAHYGSAESDSAQLIRKTQKGYVAAGLCNGMTRIFKLDDAGAVVWRKTLPTMADAATGAYFTALSETKNGGFKLGVYVFEDGDGFGSFVYSLRSCGLIIGKTELEDIAVNGIRQTSDKGFVLIGDNVVFNGDYYGVFTAIYSSMHKQWGSKLLAKDDTGHDMHGYDITETSDGGYILCGMKDGKFWLNKRNTKGEMSAD